MEFKKPDETCLDEGPDLPDCLTPSGADGPFTQEGAKGFYSFARQGKPRKDLTMVFSGAPSNIAYRPHCFGGCLWFRFKEGLAYSAPLDRGFRRGSYAWP